MPVPLACSTKSTRVDPSPARPAAPPVHADPIRIEAHSRDRAADWDAYVAQHDDGTICHAHGWRRAVVRVFGHADHSLVALRGGGICGVLPLMLVRSPLAGRMLVSVPYATYGGVLADDAATARALLDRAAALMTEVDARLIDLRSRHAADPDRPIVDRYATYRRPLPDRVDDVADWLPRKARAAARRAAAKYPLDVEFDAAHIATVWKLYGRSMRRLASPNYPLQFFEALVNELGTAVRVQLVRLDGRPAAGLVTFLHAGTAMPYFVGTDERLDAYGLNNFLYRASMEDAVRCGASVYDFGRSRRDNPGASDFKRFHGFEPQPLQYQHILAPGRAPPELTPTSPRWAIARRVWRRMPLMLTRPLGGRVARWIPG
ncbi:MAG: FemAB family PEP-CTERM system-associated protein [Phycisphaerae bacterium]|nr:FemAB family PEP-CTERM system-associated protein [Phycisphaerae bacterium]